MGWIENLWLQLVNLKATCCHVDMWSRRSNVSGWNVWPVNAWLVASMKRFRGLWCEYDEVSSETDSPGCFRVLRYMSLFCWEYWSWSYFIFTFIFFGEKGFPIWLTCVYIFKRCVSKTNQPPYPTGKIPQLKIESFRPPYPDHTPKHSPKLLIQTWLPYWFLARCWWFWYRITLHIQLAKRSHKSWPQLLGKLKGIGWRRFERWLFEGRWYIMDIEEFVHRKSYTVNIYIWTFTYRCAVFLCM